MIPYFGGHMAFQIVDTKPDSAVIIDQKTIFNITPPNSDRMISLEKTFVHPENTHNHTLKMLKEPVDKYEKELLKKQEEIKKTTRNMLKENHSIEDINKFLNSGMNEELLSIHQKLLDAYRQYVIKLEENT